MQELVQLQSVAAEIAPVPLASILSALADDAEVVFAGGDVTFELRTSSASNPPATAKLSTPPIVDADPRRTRHALMSILHAVREWARPGSAILCSVAWDQQWAEVMFRPNDPVDASFDDHLDDVARLRLVLAKANALSQRSLFAAGEEPFAISIKLPVAIGPS
jgi:hypothetical protein